MFLEIKFYEAAVKQDVFPKYNKVE